jgi:L-threonylcarbamoyladenylate synthase
MQMILNAETSHQVLAKAVSVLERGGIVVYPSDTVYGLAVDATNSSAVHKLDRLKQRRLDQKYSYNFSDFEMVKKYCEANDNQMEIIKEYLPGPFTFIISDDTSIRMPKGTIITEIVSALGKPVTATSANITGKSPAASIKSLDPKIYLAADLIIEQEDFTAHEPSTIIDISKEKPVVTRQGEASFP